MKLRIWFLNFILFGTLFLVSMIRANFVNGEKNSSACSLPLQIGTCGRALRYAYNPKTRKCVSFYSTNCKTAKNSFLTFEECRRDCMENVIY